MLSVIILSLVFLLISLRQFLKLKIQIWQIMSIGAFASLISGSISVSEALNSINIEVILFLFGMFIVGQAMEDSGYLSHLAYKVFKNAKNLDALLFFCIFGFGLSSAILMNDTIAIIGTPVVLLLAKKHEFSPKILLLALAFSITIGSVMSPIGNPQNLLIASEIKNPFAVFLNGLFLPTIISLFSLYLILKLFYREHFHKVELTHGTEPIKNKKLARLSKLSLIIIAIMIFAKIILVFFGIEVNMTFIALLGALPILIYRLFAKNFHIMRRIDYHTLIFFVAMFILMESVWISGFIQGIIERSHIELADKNVIFLVSIVLSQIISNVPLVALYMPILSSLGASNELLLILAAASTLAGNIFILGAASNIIIIQNAEKKGETIDYIEFTKIGIMLTAVCSFIYLIMV